MMVAFGLSGLLAAFSYGNSYTHRDYFHTPEFQSELDQFARNLNRFELNNRTLEQAKQSITVSEEEIDAYRSGLGNITDVITALKNDYQIQIDQAVQASNQEAADIYIAERDKKLADITNISKSDEYARAKVVSEKEEELNQYYAEREQSRAYYLSYKNQFQYDFKSSLTHQDYTNVSLADDEAVKDKINAADMLFRTSYSLPTNPSDDWNSVYGRLAETSIPFKGEIAVARDLAPTSSLMIAYNRYKHERITLWAYTLASIAALIASIVFIKKAVAVPSAVERCMPYYAKLPIDVRALCVVLTAAGSVGVLFDIKDQFVYVYDNPFVYGWNMLIGWMMASGLVVLTMIQGKMLAVQVKDWPYMKKEWERGLLNKARHSVRSLYSRAKQNLTDLFLNKSTGAQMFILLSIVFVLGLAARMISFHPVFILLYAALLAGIGLPIVMLLVFRIGYFNRIVVKTNELAVGELGQDLPVSGKSVLSTLAVNMNVLKQGVKTLQHKQAKSERLKTELITNVSHDLRTPLTSIITYTELLKKADLSGEDRRSYVDIIDRKSKRLKVLIDDLFEVSKMASGNIELSKERVDLVQLLQQALAEYDSMINGSSLQFRFMTPEWPVYAVVDGQKLWRVFDNLIGNILKYSLENSRVYITVQSAGDQVILAFKNVSKYEIRDNVDELFERFKRGDASRHAEGSGLGLAIAKSIVDLHEGHLDIEIDGDLFKVRISLKAGE